MKILILCSNYEPGGAQRAIIRLNENFKNYGYESEAIYFHRKSADFTEKPSILLNRKGENLKDALVIFYKIYCVIKNMKPDVVISFLPNANIFGLLIAYICGVRKRICSHRNISKKELSLPLKIADYLFAYFKIYTLITAVSDSTKHSFKYYPYRVFDKIKVINNGIFYTSPAVNKNECRKILNLELNTFIIGNIGRLVEQKNQLFLIEVLKSLEDIKLIIIGLGPLKNKLEEAAENYGIGSRLMIIDELDISKIPLFLKAIDVFVMPSYFEGMSNALLEALHSGLPIITNNVPSQRDVLYSIENNYNAGFLLPVDNLNDWVDSLKLLKNNEKEMEKYHALALKRAKDFSLKRMVDGFISAINTEN